MSSSENGKEGGQVIGQVGFWDKMNTMRELRIAYRVIDEHFDLRLGNGRPMMLMSC